MRQRVFGGLYHCAKFGWNCLSHFDNIKVRIFCAFGLKTPIHAPFLPVFVDKNKKSRNFLDFLTL